MASSVGSGNSPTAEEDFSIEAPLLDHDQIGAGMSGEARDVTISFWQFSFTLLPLEQPAFEDVVKHYWLRILGTMSAVFFATVLLCYWLEHYYYPLFFVVILYKLGLLLFVFRARWYYNRHGAVRYVDWLRRYTSCGGFLPCIGFEIVLARYHEVRGDFEYAIACYQQVFENYPFLRESKGGVCIYKALGSICYTTRRYEEALEHLQKAVQLRRLKDTKARGSCYQSDYHLLGATYKALGKHAEALGAYQKTVETLQTFGYGETIDVTKSLIKVGEVHETLEDLEEANKVYRQALEIRLRNEGEFPRTVAIARLHEKLGDLYCRHPDLITTTEEDGTELASATGHWNAALEVYRRNGKTDEDKEIMLLQDKLRDALNAV